MTEHDEELINQANELMVHIMFFASSKYLVRLHNDKKNFYFYTTFCLQIVDNQKFIVFTKVFKILKRKSKYGVLFSIKDNQTNTFEHNKDVKNYLNNFLSKIHPHERIVTDPDSSNTKLPAGDAIVLINKLEKMAIEYLSSLIGGKP